MPTPTYTPLATLTLSSSAASVTFSSISQAYRDLVLVVDATGSSEVAMRFTLNGDTDSNYNRVYMDGDGSTASSGSVSNWVFSTHFRNLGTTTLSQVIINFLDYSVTDKHKSFLSRFDRADSGANAQAGRWASTSAITSMNFYPASGTFNIGSTFSLYGIAA